MHRRKMYRIIALILVCLLALPAAAAQDPVDPAAEKGQEKADHATSDPAGFIAHHASNDTIEEDVSWSVAYVCHLQAVAEEESGQPLPDPEMCDDYEEVVGVEEQHVHEEEDVAEADPIEEDATTTVGTIAEDSEATVGRIVDEPGSGADETAGLIERTLDALLNLVGGIAGGIEIGLGLGWDGVTFFATAIADGIVFLVTTTIDTVAFIINGTIDGITTVITGTAELMWDGAVAIGSVIAWSASTAWDGTTAIGAGIGEVVGGAMDAVKALFIDAPADTGTTGDLLSKHRESAQPSLDHGLDLDALPLDRL